MRSTLERFLVLREIAPTGPLTGEQKQEQIQQMVRHHMVGAPIRIQMSVGAKKSTPRRRNEQRDMQHLLHKQTI